MHKPEVVGFYCRKGATALQNFPILLAWDTPLYVIEERLLEEINAAINPEQGLGRIIASRNREEIGTQLPSNQDVIDSWGVDAFYEINGKQYKFSH